MGSFWNNLNREQKTLGVVVAVALILIALEFVGGDDAATFVLGDIGDRPYGAVPSGAVDFPADDFSVYWQGKDFFAGEAPSLLPLPILSPPELRGGRLVAPLLRPSPRPVGLSEDVLKRLYVALEATPSIRPDQLPSPETLTSLAALPDPVVTEQTDHRQSREREMDVLYLKEGEPVQGIIRSADKENYYVERNGQAGRREAWPLAKVTKVERRWTYAERYEQKHLAHAAADARDRYAVARWCLETEVLKNEIPTGERLQMREEAKLELEEALRIDPGMVEAQLLLAQLNREDGDFESALRVLIDGLEHAGQQRHEVLRQIGVCWENLSVWEGALEAYRESYQKAPNYVQARVDAGRIELRLGHPEEALREVDAALGFQKGFAEALAVRGQAHLSLGNMTSAREDLTAALSTPTVGVLTALGVLEVLEGRIPEGAARWRDALQRDPYASDAGCNLGVLALSAGLLDPAEALFRTVARRDPLHARAAAGAALVIHRRGDLPAAVTAARQVCDMFPKDGYAAYLLGSLLLLQREWGDAATELDRGLALSPEFVPLHRTAGIARVGRLLAGETLADPVVAQQATEAEALLRDAAVDSDPVEAWMALAVLRQHQGRKSEALSALQTARRHREEDPLVQYVLGLTELRWGGGDDAQRVAAALPRFKLGASLASKSTAPEWARGVQQCAEAAKRLEEWKQTRVVLQERFDRPDGPDVGNKWIERDRNFGVVISLEGGRAKFSGRQVNQDLGMTSLEREIPKGPIHLLEAVIDVHDAKEAEIGFSVYPSVPPDGSAATNGVHVGRSMNGTLYTWTGDEAAAREGAMTGSWEALETAAPSDGILRFRWERREQGSAVTLTLLIWDGSEWKSAREGVPLTEGEGSTWKIAVWGRAFRDESFTFYVDDLLVHERKRK